MKVLTSLLGWVALLSMALVETGCARRMIVATGTTIGLHATPGDGKSQSPQVTLAYKRGELALVPTGEQPAKKSPGANSDSYSALAIVDFRTKWFGGTSIDQFIATGHASRDIQEPGSQFSTAFAREVSARIGVEDIMIQDVVREVNDGSGKVSQQKLEQLTKGTPLENSVSAFAGKPITEFETKLKDTLRPFAEGLHKNIKK